MPASKYHIKYNKSYKGKAARAKYNRSSKGKVARTKEKLTKYKLNKIQYDEMLLKQKAVCKICGRVNKSSRVLSVDHDHKTGKVRGLLCYKCNTLLGLISDDHTILLKTIDYLREEGDAI